MAVSVNIRGFYRRPESLFQEHNENYTVSTMDRKKWSTGSPWALNNGRNATSSDRSGDGFSRDPGHDCQK